MTNRWLALLYVLLTTASAHASRLEILLLQPTTYHSPNGVYAVFVDPSDRYGAGKATYTLTKNGKEVWKKEFPFSLWKARITDDGVIGGAAYSDGLERSKDDGTFQVALIDANGDIRFHQSSPREPPKFFHAPCGPICNGVILDSANDRMLLRLDSSDEGGESWHTYRLSDGTALGKIQPRTEMPDSASARYIIDARHVIGTPLMLVHWWRYESGSPSSYGARFSLADLDGKCVWHLDLPEDYSIPGNEKAESDLTYEMRKTGAILRTDKPGRFDVRFVADAKQVTFAVEKDSKDEWSVREVERKPYQPPKPGEMKFPQLQLKKIRSVVLRSGPEKPTNPIRDIMSFRIDKDGRLAFLRRDEKWYTLVVVDQRGSILHEMPLSRADMTAYDRAPQFAWVGGDRFVIANCDYNPGEKAKAWMVDVTAKSSEGLGDFDCPHVEQIEGMADGGFVVLENYYFRFTSSSTVAAFDKKGQKLWELEQNYQGGPAAVFSPEAIAVTTTGEVAVLDVIRHTVQFFDKGGGYLRTVNLDEAWGRKANYPSDMSADSDGGVIVRDFHARLPIVRMKADGSVHQELNATFADDRPVDSLEPARVAPDGRLWTTDNHALLRLNDKGVVDHIVGEPPDPKRLGRIGDVHIDTRGRFLAFDFRTWAVHVFDSQGRYQFVCQTSPTDFSERYISSQITTAANGDIFLGESRAGARIRFDAEGKRIELVGRKFDEICEDWLFQPEGNRLWVETYHGLRLMEGDNLIRRIVRTPENRWLDGSIHCIVATDGSIGVSAERFHIYDKNGEPVRSIELRRSSWGFEPFAYDVGYVATAVKGIVHLLDDTGKPIGQFKVPGIDGEKCYLKPYLSAKENALIVFDRDHTLTWFELPKK